MMVPHDWNDVGLSDYGEIKWRCGRCDTLLHSLEEPDMNLKYVRVRHLGERAERVDGYGAWDGHGVWMMTRLPSDCAAYVIGKIMRS